MLISRVLAFNAMPWSFIDTRKSLQMLFFQPTPPLKWPQIIPQSLLMAVKNYPVSLLSLLYFFIHFLAWFKTMLSHLALSFFTSHCSVCPCNHAPCRITRKLVLTINSASDYVTTASLTGWLCVRWRPLFLPAHVNCSKGGLLLHLETFIS